LIELIGLVGVER